MTRNLLPGIPPLILNLLKDDPELVAGYPPLILPLPGINPLILNLLKDECPAIERNHRQEPAAGSAAVTNSPAGGSVANRSRESAQAAGTVNRAGLPTVVA